jgi:hypothetical protein
MSAYVSTETTHGVMARDAAVWRKYEEEFESLGIPGVASEARTKKERQQEE